MRIGDLELFLLQPPALGGEHRTLVLRLVCDAGWEGWGEAPTQLRPDDLPEVRQLLTAALAERHVADIEELASLEIVTRLQLVSAVEIACWDAVARSAGLPLCRLWGGCFRTRVPICRRLPSDGNTSSSALIQQAREWVEQGYRSLLVPCASSDVSTSLRRLDSLRGALADGVELRVDGESRFSRLQAVDLVTQLQREDYRFLLDLLANPDPPALEHLRAVSRSPLALGGSIRTANDVFTAAPIVQHFVLSPERLHNGWRSIVRCATVADAAGISASLSETHSLGLTSAAMLHMIAALPSLAAAHDILGCPAGDSVLIEPLEPQDGMLTVPLGAGLGVEPDRTRLERLQIG